MLSEDLQGGHGPTARLPAERLRKMVAAYYRERGWTVDGKLPRAMVTDLGLDDLVSAPAGAV